MERANMLKLLTLFALPLLLFASPIPAISSNFHTLSTTPERVTISNNCNYPVYVFSVGPGINIFPTSKMVPPKAKWFDQFHSYPRPPPKGGGVSLKVSKTNTVAAPIIQFEYTVVPEGEYEGDFYNISLVDCMHGQDGSLCPGHEGGLQAVCASGDGFHCKPGEYCSAEAYVIPENGYKPGAPVKKCDRGAGIAFELCAAT